MAVGFAALGLAAVTPLGATPLVGTGRQGVGGGLSERDVKLKLSTVIVDDGVDIVDPRIGHQLEAVQQLDGQDVARPVPDPREVLGEGKQAGLDRPFVGLDLSVPPQCVLA